MQMPCAHLASPDFGAAGRMRLGVPRSIAAQPSIPAERLWVDHHTGPARRTWSWATGTTVLRPGDVEAAAGLAGRAVRLLETDQFDPADQVFLDVTHQIGGHTS
jgi:hypothetical protein